MLNCIKIHNYTVPGTLVNSSVSLPLLARWPRHATLPTNSGCVVAMHGPYKQNGFLQTNLFSVHFLSLTTRQKLEKHHSRLLHHTNISVEKRKTHKREWFISQSRALKCEKTRDMYLQESGSRHRTISMGRSSRPADNRANLTSPTGLPMRTEHSMLFGRSVRSLKKKKKYVMRKTWEGIVVTWKLRSVFGIAQCEVGNCGSSTEGIIVPFVQESCRATRVRRFQNERQ